MSNELNIQDDGGCVIVRFARPEIRNPLSVTVLEQLDDLVSSLDTRVCERLIFTGSDQLFASGADLREIASVNADNAAEFALLGQRLFAKIAELPCKTIAAINGFCMGGALDLALSCDYRIAAPNAQFAHPGTGLGIITGWGGTQRLPRLIGTTNALELFFTASLIDAERALAIGLVDEIASDAVARAIGLEY